MSKPIGESAADSDRDETTAVSPEEPLHTIRERYARCELTDAQFERKLERFLESETIEDVTDRFDARDRTAAHLTESE